MMGISQTLCVGRTSKTYYLIKKKLSELQSDALAINPKTLVLSCIIRHAQVAVEGSFLLAKYSRSDLKFEHI